MKRSASIDLRIVPAIAAAALAAGCGSPANQVANVRHCMDNTKTLVEPARCEEDSRRAAGRATGAYVPLYHWVYGPRGTAVGTHIGGNPAFYRGTRGTVSPAPSSTTRGGFGSSARPVAS
jgi:hypothetical protein